MSSSSSTAVVATAGMSKQPSAFEFTRRKRWADLLINELTDAIIFMLSSSGSILFCGNAVTELLGWKDSELVDKDFMTLVDEDDQLTFRDSFAESLLKRESVMSYVRLRCNLKKRHLQDQDHQPKTALFEFSGYPHYADNDDQCKCFFAVAKPYPRRNTAMLNSFLELKIENERLQQRLAELRDQASSSTAQLSLSAGSTATVYDMPSANSGLSSSSVQPSQPSLSSSPPSGELTSTFNTGQSTNTTQYEDATLPSLHQNYDNFNGQSNSLNNYWTSNPQSSAQPPDAEATDDTQKKKKLKKMHAAEQYVCVTCGRTDSPEWRKGPQGPKTLCNACGLRWAKQMRRVDDGVENGGNGTSARGGSIGNGTSDSSEKHGCD